MVAAGLAFKDVVTRACTSEVGGGGGDAGVELGGCDAGPAAAALRRGRQFASQGSCLDNAEAFDP